uniref:PWWP domain-containing protein n=1 Tax=Anopheles dirus TaxID=7168 RepID=A0A182NFM1_9DIPT
MEEDLADGDIVWVKVSNSWWPGEVIGERRLTEEFLSSLRKKPLAVVKFFEEDSYEYVKNRNFIFKYNCPRKHEFLRKGLEQSRANMKHMEKFPADVRLAEEKTGGDPNIVNSAVFQPQKKERYSGLFQDAPSPVSAKGKGQKEKSNTPSKTPSTTPVSFTSARKPVHEVRILAQSSATTSTEGGVAGTASLTENASPNAGVQSTLSSPGQVYHCYKCNNYSANRQNLIMLHIKHCRASYTAAGGASSTASATPTAATRNLAPEPMDDSPEEDPEPEPVVQPDTTKPSLPPTPISSKAKVLETPTRQPEPLESAPIEMSSTEKRTRGGRKAAVTPAPDTSKQSRVVARRRNIKRGHSPGHHGVGVSVNEPAVDAAAHEDSGIGLDKRRLPMGATVALPTPPPRNTSEEPSASQLAKNKTDVKLKNELLADWSEDEPEEEEEQEEEKEKKKKDAGSKGRVEQKREEATPNEMEKEEPQTSPVKEASPVRTSKTSTKKQQLQKENTSKQAPKMNVAADDGVSTKDAVGSAAVKESTEKNSVVLVAPAAATVSPAPAATTAAVSSVPSPSSAPSVVSPYTTIKYRNIPKKQKREFIEVTNDDVLPEKPSTGPSREGSTASSSSTTGSGNESNLTAGCPAPAVSERPISAKQLILNRATRGSSKSLSSGDETHATMATTTTITSTQQPTQQPTEEREKTPVEEKPTNKQSELESPSCFDFNDDDDDENRQKKAVPQQSSSTTALTPARFERRAREQKNRQKSKEPTELEEPIDRDTLLSQEIDSLLCETDVPKLPDGLCEAAITTDKIDCNRTLPPKERGKRIFKTRSKRSEEEGAASTASPEVENHSREMLIAPPSVTEGDLGKSATEEPEESSKTMKKQEDERATHQKQDQDHQHPSVTSSGGEPDPVPEPEKPQSQSAKKKRKSEEVLLPDSSVTGGEQQSVVVEVPPPPQPRGRRGKFGRGAELSHGATEKAAVPATEKPQEQASSSSSSSSRKVKRGRRDTSTPEEVIVATTTTMNKASSEDVVVALEKSEIVVTAAAEQPKEAVDPIPKEQRNETDIATTKKGKLTVTTEAPEAATSATVKSNPTPADLQVAVALINLPAAAATTTPHPGKVEEDQNDSDTLHAVVKQMTTNAAPITSNSTPKSINPRKRHLQSMMLSTEVTPPPPKQTVTTTKEVEADEAERPSALLSIPEKKKRNEEKEKEADPPAKKPMSQQEDERFDIDSMPIVMGDNNGLLVVESAEPPKGVNGAASGVNKRATGSEQIVITSKGTVLTTAAAAPSNTTVASKVTVTSAITLSTGNCRVSASSNGGSVASLVVPQQQPQQPAATTVTSPAATAQTTAPKIIITKKPLAGYGATPTASPVVVAAAEAVADALALPDDNDMASVSSSSGGSGAKKSRVLKLSPQKLKEFSRLGYVASSGSNVVIAAAADSSVQESSTLTVGHHVTSASDSPAEMEVEEEGEPQIEHQEQLQQQQQEQQEEFVGAATIVLEGSPTSSGAAPDVILGSNTELTIVGGSLVEASSSSGAVGAGGGTSGASASVAAVAAAGGGAGVQESSQLIAVPAENFGGPANLFYLCSVRDESLVPVNNELLYLDASNQLVALPEQHQQHPSQQQQHQQHHHQQQAQQQHQAAEDIIHQAEVILPGGVTVSNGSDVSVEADGDGSGGAVVTDGSQQSFLLNTQDGQHIILDQQSLMALAAAGGGDAPHIITADGQQIVLQETAQEWLAALSASQQQQQQQHQSVSTLLTPEGTQIIVAHDNAALIELQEHPAVLLPTEIMQVNPNTTIETNAVLTKPPIMSTVEVPTKNGIEPATAGIRSGSEKQLALASQPSASSCPSRTAPTAGVSCTGGSSTTSNLDETLAAVIGHVPSNPNVPTSLELPITVTNPVIAKTSTASSRLLNSVLFPLTTTATTAVSSLTDAAGAGGTLVLVPGGVVAAAPDTQGTIDRVPSSNPLAACSSPSIAAVSAKQHDGASEEEEPIEGRAVAATDLADMDEDEIQIPNTPESQQQPRQEDDQVDDCYNDGSLMYDAERDGGHPNHLLEPDDASNSSNCSEIIALQPNVVVLDGGLLLNSADDDGIDDDELEHDSEEENDADDDGGAGREHQQEPVGHEQRLIFEHRSIAVAPAANGGGDRRGDTLHLAEHHNISNNDSGIDTGSTCTISAPLAASDGGVGGGSAATRRTIVER